MNTVVSLPQKTPDLPVGPLALVLRRFEVLEQTEGFCDRVALASEFMVDLFTLGAVEAITPDQQVAILRRLRSVLQSDLGAVTADDAALSLVGGAS
ncbi:MAG TPA: hypothetical protein PLF92_02485 [Arenimonas sp.]|nr:hypothetical protein [Arenimonas sp.]HOZ05381.1 hypothetical protein [Arenimonas sp.]HPW31756.1 hypothetical protein [Arenimonas sp.]